LRFGKSDEQFSAELKSSPVEIATMVEYGLNACPGKATLKVVHIKVG
jgi:hypothetical protein